MKYTNEELEDALNTICVSEKTKITIETDFQKRPQWVWSGYVVLVLGWLFVILPFVSIILLSKENPEFGRENYIRISLFPVVGALLVRSGRAHIHGIRMRNAVTELMMKLNKSEPAAPYGYNAR